jgi:import receptor subunit TOM20
LEARKDAQSGFIDYIKKSGRAAPLLVAKFIARQVAIETNKMLQSVKSAVPGASSSQDADAAKNDFTDAEGGEYLLADHVERLRFLELAADGDGMKHLSQVLETALPGLEQFVTEERHVTLLGKMAYNAYGVYFDGGRDDKVSLSVSLHHPPRLNSH